MTPDFIIEFVEGHGWVVTSPYMGLSIHNAKNLGETMLIKGATVWQTEHYAKGQILDLENR